MWRKGKIESDLLKLADDHRNDDGYNQTNDSHPALDLILQLGRVLDDVDIAILSSVFLKNKRETVLLRLWATD
jgi:hypothetical protein